MHSDSEVHMDAPPSLEDVEKGATLANVLVEQHTEHGRASCQRELVLDQLTGQRTSQKKAILKRASSESRVQALKGLKKGCWPKCLRPCRAVLCGTFLWFGIFLLLLILPPFLLLLCVCICPCMCCRSIPDWMPREASREALMAIEHKIVKRRFKHTTSEYIDLASGINAHVLRVTPPDVPDSNPVLVFVHGLSTDSVKCFGNTVEEIEKRGAAPASSYTIPFACICPSCDVHALAHTRL